MSSTVRTLLSGLAALSVCLVMASLKSVHLLLGLAVAGLVWAAWSAYTHARRSRQSTATWVDEPLTFSRAERRQRNNVYDFPSPSLSGAGDA